MSWPSWSGRPSGRAALHRTLRVGCKDTNKNPNRQAIRKVFQKKLFEHYLKNRILSSSPYLIRRFNVIGLTRVSHISTIRATPEVGK